MIIESISQFIPQGKIGERFVGITLNTRFGKDPIINVVEQHKPTTKKTTFKDVENATLSRLSDTNFGDIGEAKRFIQTHGPQLLKNS